MGPGWFGWPGIWSEWSIDYAYSYENGDKDYVNNQFFFKGNFTLVALPK